VSEYEGLQMERQLRTQEKGGGDRTSPKLANRDRLCAKNIRQVLNWGNLNRGNRIQENNESDRNGWGSRQLDAIPRRKRQNLRAKEGGHPPPYESRRKTSSNANKRHNNIGLLKSRSLSGQVRRKNERRNDRSGKKKEKNTKK